MYCAKMQTQNTSYLKSDNKSINSATDIKKFQISFTTSEVADNV